MFSMNNPEARQGESGRVKDVLRRVKRIELKTRRLVDGFSHGQYTSVFRGRGIEFSEVREYQPGDDIRSIEWNVTARMNTPYVKEFIEERDLTVILLFDVSASGEFGTELEYKKEAGAQIASSILFSATQNNDNVGLLLSTDIVEKYVPPRKGKKHAMRILYDLTCFHPKSRRTDLKKSLEFLAKVLKKRSVIFIISDFLDDLSGAKYLGALGRRHDVIGIILRDGRERELPDSGYVELEDCETGEHMTINTSDPAFRESFKKLMEEKKENLLSLMRKNRMDTIDVPTSSGWEKEVMNFFRRREKRCMHMRA